MIVVALSLRRIAQRWPSLGRRRAWWFRPAYELLTLLLPVLSLAWLVPSGGEE